MVTQYLSVPKAIELVTGERPHPSTCWRWAIRGVGGVRLKTWLVGGRRKTTTIAVNEFIQARSAIGDIAETAGRADKMLAELNRELGL